MIMNKISLYLKYIRKKQIKEIIRLFPDALRIRNYYYVCYAPFSSLYFDLLGDVFPCCENTVYSYGKYPYTNLHDIWFGERIKLFRKYISKGNLQYGCRTCEVQFEAGNKAISKASFYKFEPPKSRYPVKMEFRLSNACNLACSMCDDISSSQVRKLNKKEPLPNPYDDEFVRQLEEFIPHLRLAHFVGGEPFIIPIFFKIWERIISLNKKCKIVVQTNATVLNDRIKELLNEGDFNINISLDSLDKETYESIRVNSVFEETMNNVMFFINYCKEKNSEAMITACPMQQNWHELPQLVRFCNDNQIALFFHTVYRPIEYSLFGFTNEKLQDIYDILSKEEFSEKNQIERNNAESFKKLLYQIKSFYSNKEIVKAKNEKENETQIKQSIVTELKRNNNIFKPNDERNHKLRTSIIENIKNTIATNKNIVLPLDISKEEVLEKFEIILDTYKDNAIRYEYLLQTVHSIPTEQLLGEILGKENKDILKDLERFFNQSGY
jgi:MoaA/NifB/PqqE/SkfB family radical SAM enzyme